MKKPLRIRFAEWAFNRFLKPFEKVVVARKVMVEHGDHPEVKAQFEKRYGVDRLRRNPVQWANLVDDYGLERVARIENMSEYEVKRKCLKFSDRLKHDFKNKHKDDQPEYWAPAKVD